MRQQRRGKFFGVIAAALIQWCQMPAAVAQPATATQLEMFSPQGTVKSVRQVSARFSAPMVAFGDLRLADPFTVQCVEPGVGRWIDASTWSYDFERDLPAGVRCQFTLKADLKDSDGNKLAASTKLYEFSTGGPAILRALPYEGNESIDENQIFLLGLDAPANEKSILKNAFCRVEGINEKIGVHLIEGQQRDELLQQRNGFLNSFATVYFQRRGVLLRGSFKITDSRFKQLPLVLLQCNRSLFANTRVDLVWGAGIESSTGIASVDEQSLSFRTRPEFSAQFNCERVSSKAHCIPFLPMSVSFSAPIKRSDAESIDMVGVDGRAFHPEFSDSEKKADYIDRITFKGPFPEQGRFAIRIPANLQDDAQRKLANQASFPLAVETDELPPLAKFAARFGIVELQGGAVLPVTLRNIEAQVDTRVRSVDSNSAAQSSQLSIAKEPVSKEPTSKDPASENLVSKPVASLPGQTLRAADDKEILDWLYRLQEADQVIWGSGGEETNIYPGEQSIFTEVGTSKPQAAMQHFQLPKPSGAKEFEVVGIPLPKAGFYIVELTSPKLGAALTRRQTPMYVSAGALVTNLAAHFKHGTESSLVWVTTLDKALPVAGADIAVRNCAGALLWQGKTDQRGIANIAEELPKTNCPQRGDDYFISARSGADMTFTLSSWSGGIQAWRFNLPYAGYQRDNAVAHTVFDRTLLMANDTLHMKHFRRAHTAGGLALPDSKTLPDKMLIRHVGSDQTYELPLNWAANGSAENAWKAPADAKQGTYNVEIGGRETGSFRIEAFRVPTMKALLQGPKNAAVQAAAVDVDIQLNYLAGGAAAHAPIKVRSALENRDVSFPDYGDYVFSNGEYKSNARGEPVFDDETAEFYSEDDAPDSGAGKPGGARTQNVLLDKDGAARVTIDKLPRVDRASALRTEVEYRDANGETLTSSTRIALWPAQYLIGLQAESGAATDGNLHFTSLVLDLNGKPVANAQVTVDFLQRSYLSHRRRLIGGFYAYENSEQIKPLGTACSGSTDNKGLLTCDVKAPASGNIILQASTSDAQGNRTIVHQDRWVAGADDMWFAASDNDRIDLLPVKKRYEPGDTAELQVRMPFRTATALITVEREGILDSYVQTLSGKNPTVKIPIKNNYAPNLYVSVFIVRGRVDAPQPTALVDLAKPSYKMGLTELQVGWRAHELTVNVATDKPVYTVRDKAKIKIKVRRADGGALPAGSEVALAAIDEGLLELKPNDSWQLLAAMMQRRPLEVETATAQMQVIGKRHFGRKAVPNGGGGGKSAARELLDAMLFWRGRVLLDSNGEASVEVPLNDALTTFRVVAIASGGSGLFGTSSTALRSTQDLILVAGLPPLVREGDRLRAGFTVRNTAQRSMHVDITATLTAGGATAQPLKLAAQSMDIAAGQARQIGWPLQVPQDITALQWDVLVKESIAMESVATESIAREKLASEKNKTEKVASDRLRIKQQVIAAIPVRTLQATLLQLDKPVDMPVQIPADALPGRGGLQTLLVDKLGGALPGVREYMSAYPYSCFEQQASRAVALRNQEMWQALMATIPTYLDSDGLLKYFPLLDEGSDSLTAYVLSIADAAGYQIPENARQRMLVALGNFVEGKIVRSSVLPTADLSVRKLAALEALARADRMRPQLLDSIRIEPNLWPTSALLDWYGILMRAQDLPQRSAALHEAEHILRARLNLQGTSMGFSTERNDALWWLMVSTDSNANRLLLSMLDNPAWRDDIGRLARGALGRQQRGHWSTTVANAWGVLALEKFSQQFESAAVAGETAIELAFANSASATPTKIGSSEKQDATQHLSMASIFNWSEHPGGGSVSTPWPEQRATLSIEHRGSGKPWATVQSLAAVPLKKPLSSGYKIVKTITAIDRKTAAQWSVGDVYRVHLDLEAQSDMTWVVVDDPIPAGATILGSGLGADSKILSAGARQQGWARPAFEERSFAAYRAYYQMVPKGKWSLEYSVRVNNEGEFGLPPTRVEAMYAPEMFGAAPSALLSVAP